MSDISGLDNINDIYNSSLFKKWIKLIPIDKTIPFDKYNRKDNFIPIADIILDNDIFTSGKKQGNKKRNTLIQFIPKISIEVFNKKTEFTIEIFGKQTKIIAQTYHAYKSTLLEDYKKIYGEYPILSDNSDPDYKN